jgi:hypothetical protein
MDLRTDPSSIKLERGARLAVRHAYRVTRGHPISHEAFI